MNGHNLKYFENMLTIFNKQHTIYVKKLNYLVTFTYNY